MTRDDIMLWAVQARLPSHYETGEPMWPDRLERFAALVAAHTLSNIDPRSFMSYQEGFAAGAAAEREAIAQMIEDAPALVKFATNEHGGCLMCGFTPKLAAAAIRARGETK